MTPTDRRTALRSAAAAVAIAAASALAPGFAGPTPAGAQTIEGGTTPNWAGYVVTARTTTFTSVTATWRQPLADCSRADGRAAVAFWVGLGGSTPAAQGLEQAGTSSSCDATGAPVYRAWYELPPAPPATLALRILPGNRITVSVNVDPARSTALFQLKNRTRGTTVTRDVSLVAPPDLSSAEWITEAPTGCAEFLCLPVPLLDFRSVAFTRIAATGNDIGGTITRSDWTARSLRLQPATVLALGTSRVDVAGALTSEPAPHGRSFRVVWLSGGRAA